MSGSTLSSDFPATPGAYSEISNGDRDGFVSKIDSGLETLLASTLLGGDNGDSATSLAIDQSGNVYVSGSTSSTDFPTTEGAYEVIFSGREWTGYQPFISKLDSRLTALLGSTFLGGLDACVESHLDCRHQVSSLAVDQNGDVYVTGATTSPFFPTTFSAYDVTHDNWKFCDISDSPYSECVYSYDIFISKLNNNLTIIKASTYLGEDGDQFGRSIILDQSGNVYVAGDASEGGVPVVSGAFSRLMGASDVFVAKFSADLSAETPIRVLEPDGVDDLADAAFTITWANESSAYEVDISLYYDADNEGMDGTLIVDSISEQDETGAYIWNTSGLPVGDYYVYAVIDDGIRRPTADYGDGPISVIRPVHFDPVWSGDPYNGMLFRLTGVNGGDLSPGDEIGVFDGDACVGAGVVTGPISAESPMTITTSMEDGDGAGFSEGNPVRFKIWLAGGQWEIVDVDPEYFEINGGAPVSPPGFEGNSDIYAHLNIDIYSPVICTDPFGNCYSCPGDFPCHTSIQRGAAIAFAAEGDQNTIIMAGPGDYEENIAISDSTVLIIQEGCVTLGPTED